MIKTIVDYARAGDLAKVQELAEKASDGSLSMAVVWSAEVGELEIVRWIMENHGQRVIDWNLGLAVVWSANNGYLEIVEYLMEHYGERVSDGSLRWALARSAEEGHFEVVKYLKGILKGRDKNE